MNGHYLTSSHPSPRPEGDTELVRTEASDNDPVLPLFLDFLDRDIEANPERLQAVDARLLTRIDSIIGGIGVDINAPLSADEE